MISEAALLGKANAYAKTKAGKEKMNECLTNAVSTGKPLASGSKVVSQADMDSIAKSFLVLLRRKFPASIGDLGYTLGYSKPVKKPDGSYEVVFTFRSELHRDSISSEPEYAGGIDNIVALFNNGYNANNSVYGVWNVQGSGTHSSPDTVCVKSVSSRAPLQFMQEAKAEFDGIYGAKYGVTVVLGSDYL